MTTLKHKRNRYACQPDYVCDLFDTLDSKIPLEFLPILDNQDLIYLFEFYKNENKGKLTVYKDCAKEGGIKINPVSDLINNGKLWFNKLYTNSTSIIANEEKYTAIASVFDIDNPFIVNLDTPIISIVINDLTIPGWVVTPLPNKDKASNNLFTGKASFDTYYQSLKR